MRAARPLGAAIVVALFLCIPAQAEVTEQGDLITTFQAEGNVGAGRGQRRR
jgi:hypothetical protein